MNKYSYANKYKTYFFVAPTEIEVVVLWLLIASDFHAWKKGTGGALHQKGSSKWKKLKEPGKNAKNS